MSKFTEAITVYQFHDDAGREVWHREQDLDHPFHIPTGRSQEMLWADFGFTAADGDEEFDTCQEMIDHYFPDEAWIVSHPNRQPMDGPKMAVVIKNPERAALALTVLTPIRGLAVR
jgi:hypothetical protein